MVLMLQTGSLSYAKVSVYDRDELREELAKPGTQTIELMESITVRKTMKVRGKKILTGPGSLVRAIAANSAFGGNLLRVESGILTLRNITINGRGDADVLRGKLYGWLVQIDGGTLVIDDGAILKNNKNSTRAADGGGAVRVSGGVLTMVGGTITGNESVSGGAGVRIESGGFFYMKGGRITGNRVVGRSAVEGFDGRGAGVYNRGTAGLYKGSITANRVSEYRSSGKVYGGVGGGVCNMGSILLGGTVITGNSSIRGKDVGAIRGNISASGTVNIGEIWLKASVVLHIGNSFGTVKRVLIAPESIKNGVRIADGVSKGKWKRWFRFPSGIKGKGLKLSVDRGVLCLKSRSTPAPTRTPAPKPAYGEDSMGTGGATKDQVKKPAPTAAPRIYPTYRPISTVDPMSEIGLYTDPPMLIQTPIPTVVPYSIPYMVPQVGSPERSLAPPTAEPTTAPTAEPTIVPTALGYSRTLPEYLLYPPDRGYHRDEINKLSHYLIYPPEATSMPPVEIYRLEAEDIKRLRARLEGGGYSDKDFLEELGELANE